MNPRECPFITVCSNAVKSLLRFRCAPVVMSPLDHLPRRPAGWLFVLAQLPWQHSIKEVVQPRAHALRAHVIAAHPATRPHLWPPKHHLAYPAAAAAIHIHKCDRVVGVPYYRAVRRVLRVAVQHRSHSWPVARGLHRMGERQHEMALTYRLQWGSNALVRPGMTTVGC